jgi:hypothetical protein
MPLCDETARAVFSKPPPPPSSRAMCASLTAMYTYRCHGDKLTPHFTSLQIIASRVRTRVTRIVQMTRWFKHKTIHKEQTQTQTQRPCADCSGWPSHVTVLNFRPSEILAVAIGRYEARISQEAPNILNEGFVLFLIVFLEYFIVR